MNQSEINWKSGEVVIWGLDDLDLVKPLDSQMDILREDLVLVKFLKYTLLDLGWYPEFDSNGHFVLTVVQCKHNNCEDWENPILKLKFRDASQFMQNLNQAIEAADRLAST